MSSVAPVTTPAQLIPDCFFRPIPISIFVNLKTPINTVSLADILFFLHHHITIFVLCVVILRVLDKSSSKLFFLKNSDQDV